MIQVTFTFANQAELVSFLTAGQAKSPTPAAAPAPTPSTAPAAAAPAAKDLSYDSDILPALQALAKRLTPVDFRAKLTEWGITKVPELKAKPELYATIMKACAT